MTDGPRELQPVTFLKKDADSFHFTDFTPRHHALEERAPADVEPAPEDLEVIEATGLDVPPEDPDQLALDLEAAVKEAAEATAQEPADEPTLEPSAPKVPPA